MSKGTIIYVGQFEMPDKNAAAHRVVNNGKIFRSLEYRVVFLGTVRGKVFDGVKKSAFQDDVFEEAYPLSLKQWLKHVFSISGIKSVVEKYDDVKLIIMYNTPYAKYKSVKRFARRKHIKVAYDCTEWNSFASGSLFKRLYKQIDEFEIRNLLGKKNDNLIIISNCMKNKYKGCNLLKLPPLVDTEEPIWNQNRLEHNDTFEFCFAGTTNNKERLDIVISAFSNIDNPKIRLRIIGLTKDDYIKEYKINACDIDGRIIFMDKISHKEAVKYTLSCDCYIFIREPSKRNMAGFPTKFAEAYTCGVPIISTNVSDIKQYYYDKTIILDSVSDKLVTSAMLNAVKAIKIGCSNSINKTFDYRNYKREAELWISKA